jgi:hypothetical protein
LTTLRRKRMKLSIERRTLCINSWLKRSFSPVGAHNSPPFSQETGWMNSDNHWMSSWRSSKQSSSESSASSSIMKKEQLSTKSSKTTKVCSSSWSWTVASVMSLPASISSTSKDQFS